MKQQTINLYNFDELSDEAKIKALEKHNENNDYEFLEDNLSEYLNELLQTAKIQGVGNLLYSLSYSQGDGVCFTGQLEYKGFNFSLIHNGRYYYSNSVNIIIGEKDDNGDELKADLIELLTDETEKEFIELYKEICDKIEKCGYEQIEYEQSEKNFKEICEMNEYTFEKNGEMRNF